MEYAKLPPWYQTRAFCLVLWLAGLLIAVFIAYEFVPAVWRHGCLLYYQRQVSTLRLSPTQIVYDDTQGATVPAGADPRDYDVRTLPGGRTALVYDPQAVAHYLDLNGKKPDPGATLCLRRLGVDGHESIVIVRFNYMRDGGMVAQFGGEYVWTSGLVRTAHMGSWIDEVICVPGAPTGIPLRIYAPDPDPADPLHFTARYELGTVPGTIEGRFRSDGMASMSIPTGPLSHN